MKILHLTRNLFLLTTVTLALLLISSAGLLSGQSAQASHSGGTVYADINGLVCDFCARALEKVFGRQDEVESIKVDLNQKLIIIHFNGGQRLDDATITSLINDSGYDVRGLRYE